jgi:hypothetical protein
MNRGRGARIAASLCIITVAFGPSAAQAASAEPPADTRDGQAKAASTEDPSVRSLVEDYGLSAAQARAQMEAQVAAGRAEAQLPQRLAEVYSGREIHHERGGHVVVGLTDGAQAESIRQHFARFGVGGVEVRRFTHTQAQLERKVREADALLKAGRAAGGEASVEVGRRTLGKITVRVARHDTYGARAQLSGSEGAILATAAASPGLYEVVEVDRIAASAEEVCDFTSDIECDPPLRGSVRITGPGICSAGFNAVSRSDGKPYVLTAGHCDTGSGNWSTQFANESSHVIGPFHNSQNDTVTDVGILRVNNPAPAPAGWSFGWPLITVDPTGGEAAQENYVIGDVLNPGLRDRVCATLGNSARTDCGTVEDLSVTGGGTAGLFQVSALCTEGGDSGSPYFALHVAYGIHSAGDGVSGTTGCQYGRAEHAIEAQNEMNVNIIRA